MQKMTTKQKALIAYVTIFLVGLFTGVLISNTFTLQTESTTTELYEPELRGERSGWQRQRGERPERGDFGSYMARRLSLEADQQDAFLEKLRAYNVNVRETMQERREEEGQMILQKYLDFRDEITELLSEDQLLRLDGMVHPDSVRQRGAQRTMRQGGQNR